MEGMKIIGNFEADSSNRYIVSELD
jgi:hypothetical protein